MQNSVIKKQIYYTTYIKFVKYTAYINVSRILKHTDMEFCCIKKINWNYVSTCIGFIIIVFMLVTLFEYNKEKENDKQLYYPYNITMNDHV
jgi:hypothetical protein